MQLKTIKETFLPDMLQDEFGREIFENIDQYRHLSVKGSAGSAPSVFAAELFVTRKKNVLFLIEDKEDALYATAEMEDLLGKDNVLYFPATHLAPYQIEKTQNANLVLRTDVLNKLNASKKPKVIIASFSSLSEKVLKKEDFKAISHRIKVGESLDFDFTGELLQQFNFQHFFGKT